MIPPAHLTAWRPHAPWAFDEQVEQDLILSRAMVEIFKDPMLAANLAFRGGTALHKLFLDTPERYSEDLDFVQMNAGPIGPIINGLRVRLDPWLGKPQWKLSHGRATLFYRFFPEGQDVASRRVKVEINTREHFAVFALIRKPFALDNPWFSGQVEVTTFALEELLGTKLRALYQRKKGRDLFDLWLGLGRSLGAVEPSKIVDCFTRYMSHAKCRVSRAEFEANLADKLGDRAFTEDVFSLLRTGAAPFNAVVAGEQIVSTLIVLIPGEPWKPQK